ENNVLDEGVEQFCTNRFTPIRAYQKRLVLFSDEQSLPKNISNIMKLVGGNNLTGEQKGKPAFQFRFTGMAMLVSEHPIAQGVKGNGWKRRVIPVPMNLKVADKNRRDLRAEFQPELAAFTNYLLSLSDEFVTQTLRGVGDIPECKLQFWQSRLREDSIAAWVNDCVIRDPSAKTSIGSDKSEAEKITPITLFGSYADYCKRSGMTPKSVTRFSPELVELCQSGLGWEVQRIRTRSATQVSGVRLRIDGKDDDILTHEQSLSESVKTSDDESVKSCVKTETPSTQGRVECEDFTQHTLNTNPEDSPESPEQSGTENLFKVGDRVILLNCDKTGVVIEIDDSRFKKTLHIQLDNGIGTWEDPWYVGLAPTKQPEPEPKVKPAIANLTPSDKERWLENNYNARKEVWVELDDYQGEAKLKGLRDGKWLVEPPHKWSPIPVESDLISVLESQLGKFKPTPKPPAGDQVELPLEQLPEQTESPKQRVKRLAKQQKIKLTSDDFNFSLILNKYQKSEFKQLSDEELTEIADVWESQIERTKREQDKNRITKHLER
ncbi:MAG: hypothetical protein VKK42_00530, partial [Lyngbya sp.]|nr:hypothetical protein [Lyngbya sp.]